MKKLSYMLAACLIGIAAMAQKVTEKELQGTWKMTHFNAGGVEMDIVNNKINISKELESQLTPQMLEQLKANGQYAIEPFKSSYAIFDKNNVKQVMGEESTGGLYTIIEKDGQQFLRVTYDDGLTDDTGVFIKDNLLHIVITGDGDDSEMIYAKQ